MDPSLRERCRVALANFTSEVENITESRNTLRTIAAKMQEEVAIQRQIAAEMNERTRLAREQAREFKKGQEEMRVEIATIKSNIGKIRELLGFTQPIE